MKKTFLFVHPPEEETDISDTFNLKIDWFFLKNSDKETLLKIIETLMDNNDALRRYIHALEKRYD